MNGCSRYRDAGWRLGAAFAIALPAAPVTGAGHYTDAGLDYLYDDNIGRAEHDADILDDHVVNVSGALSVPQLINAQSGLLHVARLDYDRHVDFGDLSHLTASLATTYRYKPGVAYTSPWFEANLTAALLQFEDSDIRDGGFVRASASIGRNLTERMLGRLTYRYDLRRAWDADVFDLDNHRISGNADFQFSDRVNLYGTIAWQSGEVVSTATPSAEVLGASEARSIDTALSERPAGAAQVGNYYQGDRVAYRLDADSITAEIGLNIAVSRSLALDLSALRFDAYGDGDNDYDGVQLRAGLLYRF